VVETDSELRLQNLRVLEVERQLVGSIVSASGDIPVNLLAQLDLFHNIRKLQSFKGVREG